MTPRRLAVALALLVALPALWTGWSSDRRRIEARLEELADAVEKSAPEGALEAVAAARAVTGVFAEPFEIRAAEAGFTTRERQDLMRFVHRYRSTSERIAVDIAVESLDIAGAHSRATMVATFLFRSGGPLGDSTERYRVQANWVEREGEWKIDYIDLLEIVQGDGRLGF
ncbi:MAG: hypothetical protein R3244_07180 [Thermoanaerobaculia bacterium]|nr:hypothetical protein [Thermoanaerobaculia bacterium]